MYGLPDDFDPTASIGKRLDRICFAQFIVFFYFDDDSSVNVESSFVLIPGPKGAPVKHAPPVLSSSVMSLIGKEVVRTDSKPDGTLLLVFENGASLQFLDDKAPHYESYVIKTAERDIVV
jgi:hypothetical protein